MIIMTIMVKNIASKLAETRRQHEHKGNTQYVFKFALKL